MGREAHFLVALHVYLQWYLASVPALTPWSVVRGSLGGWLRGRYCSMIRFM